MTITMRAILFSRSFFFGLLLFLELGRRRGVRQLQRDPEGARTAADQILVDVRASFD